MAGKYLLDTNIVIAHLDHEKQVNDRIQVISEIFVSATVVGELYFGAFKSGRVPGNIDQLAKFIQKVTVLTCSATTARIYGEIKNELRLLGKPIPDNDLWIAASVREHGLILSTRDVHFSYVPNIMIENW